MWKYALAWFPMVPITVANGLLRQTWLAHHLAELPAHQVSTATAALLLGVYSAAVVRRWPPSGSRQALAVGALWALMTVAFEFGFGHYVAGHAWARLLHDYDLTAGRVWVLLLAWIAVAPMLLRRRRACPPGGEPRDCP